MAELDYEINNFRMAEHLPGYTGFVPKMQNNFAQTFSASTRVAMATLPVTTVETMTNDFRRNRRTLRTNSPLPGTGFLGIVGDANDLEDTNGVSFRVYAQGGPVNLGAYYQDSARKVERMRETAPKLLMQRKNPVRNMSQIPFGDAFYYVGKHMYSTTMQESYSEDLLPPPPEPEHAAMDRSESSLTKMSTGSANAIRIERRLSVSSQKSSPSSRGVSSARPGTGTSSGHPELSKSNNRTQHTASKCGIEGSISYRYKSTQALVGKARLDTLHRDIADRVSSKVVSGNKDMIRMFYFFATIEKGVGVIGHMEFEAIARKMGTYVTAREAEALFGRYDTDTTGRITYFKFIENFMDLSDQIVVDDD